MWDLLNKKGSYGVFFIDFCYTRCYTAFNLTRRSIMNAADVMINLKKRFDEPEAVVPGHVLISRNEYLAFKELMDDLDDLRTIMKLED